MAATKGVDLAKVFGAVAKTLGENRDSLNQADDYNHDHGDHMVQTFDVITRAMKEKKMRLQPISWSMPLNCCGSKPAAVHPNSMRMA